MDSARRERARDRHPPVGRADARRTSAIPRRTGEPVYDLTYENVQAGERTSHLFRLANQHDGARRRHRRPVRARARLGDVRRGRPHGALQRQRLGAQDAHPVPHPLGRRQRRARRATRRRAAVDPRHRDLAGAVPCRQRRCRRSRASAARTSSGRTSCRTSTSTTSTRFGFRPSQDRVPRAPGLGRPDARCVPRARARRCAARVRPGDHRALAARVPHQVPRQPVQAIDLPNGPKVGSGGSLSPRGDWRAPSDSSAAAWLDELDRNVPS